MRIKTKLLIIVAFALMLSFTVQLSFAAPPLQDPPKQPPTEYNPHKLNELQSLDQDAINKIDRQVIQELATSNQTDYFIWLREKADLRPATLLATKEEKGRFVFETLRRTAERSQASLKTMLDQQSIEYQAFYISNKILVRQGQASQLASFAIHPDVAKITPNRQYKLPEPIRSPITSISTLNAESNIQFINADDVWAMGITGQGTVLAGNDTGLDWDHPALIEHYRGWNGVTADHNYSWWDATGTYTTEPGDGDGHGTHTTGTMVGAQGDQNQIGVAPGAKAIHCKNLDDFGFGNDQWITECFQWNLAPWDLNGANPMPELAPDAVNNSWGGPVSTEFEDEIDALQAAGILVEFSAGNSGPGCSTLGSPGDHAQVLTTGSVDHSGGFLPGTITWFSSRGPSFHDVNATIPDIMAPGENILSSVPGNQYAAFSGTSMSGPHTTALIGLMWSANPGLRGQLDLTTQIILDTAIPLQGQSGSNCGGNYDTGPNFDWGYGTIDAYAAVQEAILYGSTGYISGYITDQNTSAPISEATIQASANQTFTFQTRSDSTGYYSLLAFEDDYTVDVSRYGYVSAQITNISVISETTTTLDISLTPASIHTVSGTVTDAQTGWPLTAQIDIDGYPHGPIFTNPLDGSYSVELAGSVEYTFRVTTDQHFEEARTVGFINSDQTEDFALTPDLSIGCPPGGVEVTLFEDDFETGFLSANWTTVTTGTGQIQVSSLYPYEGVFGGVLDSNIFAGDGTASLIYTEAFSTGEQVNLSFWWRDFYYGSGAEDGIYLSSDNGATWTNVYSFEGYHPQYQQSRIDLQAAAQNLGLGLNDEYLVKFYFEGFHYAPYDGIALDFISLSTCNANTVGRVIGHILDENTGLPLSN
ncbi:MAG: S8 family serine peptidase, partial [Chloroflexota bacterium]